MRKKLAVMIVFALANASFGFAQVGEAKQAEALADNVNSLVESRCFDCHSGSDPSAGFALDENELSLNVLASDEEIAVWEKVLRRIASGQMPPPDSGATKDQAGLAVVTSQLEALLDLAARKNATVPRVGAIRRLTRTEYQNAIRDLLAIDFDVRSMLPKDESSHGFDNITVEELSPTLINRYLSAAESISRMAVGGSDAKAGVTIRVPADRSQEQHVDGLPLGTRGGTLFTHQFSQSGIYEIEIKLTRDRDEKVEGLHRKHHIDVLIDKGKVHRFLVEPPPVATTWEERDFTHSDSHLKTRFTVDSGPHTVGVTFPRTSSSIEESKRQPFDANFNRHRHPRKTPAIFQVTIFGPYDATGTSATPSRRLIFGDERELLRKTSSAQRRRDLASKIIARLATRAYRRPVEPPQLDSLMRFYDQVVKADGLQFELGIQNAVTAILVNPNFLLRVEQEPDVVEAGSRYAISDLELASRLSFFLWSSIPDDKLLKLAIDKKLRDPKVLRSQVDRMLRDEKANSLVTNFADQWLYLRNLESITPDLRLYPDFDDNLRQSFRQETLKLFQYLLNQNESVLGLIQSDFTFLNERLASHYNIPGVRGDHFRKVELPTESLRGGILRHGSILMVTSYATRTSPTIRGNWVLENVLGTPAPPPPANVPNLKENTFVNSTSVRERLAQHRKDPACASCHDLMDPVGFSLENFDVVGRWREYDDGIKVDNAGRLPDGTKVQSLDDLEQGILKRPEMFVTAMTEKLFTFAIGRGVEPVDGAQIRQIVRDAKSNDYRFHDLIAGIVMSQPFQMRSVEE